MLYTCCCLGNFVRNASDVVRHQFVVDSTYAKLAFLAAAAHEESTDVVHEGRVERSCAHLTNVGSIVLIKVDASRREDDRDIANTALAVLIQTPGEAVTNPRRYQCVGLATRN